MISAVFTCTTTEPCTLIPGGPVIVGPHKQSCGKRKIRPDYWTAVHKLNHENTRYRPSVNKQRPPSPLAAGIPVINTLCNDLPTCFPPSRDMTFSLQFRHCSPNIRPAASLAVCYCPWRLPTECKQLDECVHKRRGSRSHITPGKHCLFSLIPGGTGAHQGRSI